MSGWNFSAMIVGGPEFGKSTIASTIVQRHILETKGIVLAHDPVHQFGPDGCHWYADANAWRAASAAAHAEKRELPRGASIGGDPEDITKLATEIGERSGNRDKHCALPILVPYDEASLMEDSGSTYIAKQDNRLLALRRHRGIGPLYNLQQPTQLVKRFWMFCTDAYLFAQTSSDAKKLDDFLLLEPGTLVKAGVTRLPMHRYIHVRRGRGISQEVL